MPSDRSSLRALKRIIAEVDLILETTPLPENRTARSRELLRAAMVLADDLLAQNSKSEKSPAAILGSKGGSATAKKLGSEHFKRLAAMRKTRGGGRPIKPQEAQ